MSQQNTKQKNNECEINEYTKIINNMTKNTVKQTIDLISKTEDESFKVLIGMTINKIMEFSSENVSALNECLSYILNASKALENPVSILFLLLENLSQKKDEVARLKILEILSKHHYSVSNIINMLYKEDTHTVILEILKMNENLIDEFIKTSILIDNSTVSKNISLILPSLDPKHFISYNSFLSLFESENHHMRNCLLEIFQGLILSFREQENIEAIRELIELVSERLYDVNFYVRSKALGVIGDLFKKECILKDQRNHIIEEIIGRTKDKTVIVRKKSISLLTQILINHPFKDRKYLDSDTTSLNSKYDDNTTAGSQKRMLDDFNEFVQLMESCLENIVGLLDYNLKTDLLEISDFIKTAYLLKLKGSKEAIQKILGTVFTKDKQIIIEIFKEILTKRGEILYEFINDKAFEAILGCLDIDEKILYKNIFNNQRVFESIYILRQSQKGLSESNGLALLQFVTDILFRSKDESDLRRNIDTYINTLCILKNMNNRIEHNSDIFTLAIKNVIKMVFFERSVIKNTVEMIYYTSINPEITTGKMLKSLCLTKSTLKIVDAIGSVALNQFYLLERLERTLQRNEIEIDQSNIKNIRERRKSIEDIRRTSLSRMSIDRSSNKRGRLSLNFEDLQESLKNKADEEIADFFFYLKEKEILYSTDSMLHQFIPILVDSLQNEDPEIKAIAYSSLFKCMLISSEFFNEYRHLIREALYSPVIAVKNNAISAIHDFMIFYNTLVDPSLLFDKLNDNTVNKNAILVIFDLLQKNIIRLKNNSIQLASLIFDEQLGRIVRTLIRNLSSNNNAISSIFYDSFVGGIDVEIVRYLAGFIAPTIQEALFLKCIKNGSEDIERLKAIFEVFKLSEKFIKENMFREEMKQILKANNKEMTIKDE